MVIGDTLGPYRVLDKLGEGGMGQVFRARDTKLNRDVALKVLPDSFANDADRLMRFTREAQTLASLNHPHIAAIYGLEEGPSTASGQAGVRALVMELVEGEDLSQRIARLRAQGASARQAGMPLDEALPIAKQIAEALEAAHEQGIVHRDLKPANIKVRADGTVKVLDFGLAKALDARPASATADNSPTIAAPAHLGPGYDAAGTEAGMILGTAAYMSPEQARGKTVDKRADIWAFGAVLFEMLTGARLFSGATVSDTLAAVLKTEPDWTKLPVATPAPIRTLLRRCLEKDRKRRLDSAAAARLEIDDALTAPMAVDGGASSASPSLARLAWMIATTAVVGLLAFAVPALRHLRETAPPAPPETRTEIVTPATDQPQDFALSPDGRQIVFVASGDGASRLWLRSLATTTAQPLGGTEGATYPFWSPDSHSIGFFAGGALKRLDLGGGAPQTLTRVIAGQGGTWNAGGVIVFAPGGTGPLLRVSATGGAAVAVTTLALQQSGHVAPFFFSDGRRFLFRVIGAPDTAGIYLGALEGSAPTRLTPADSRGVNLPTVPGGADPTSRAERATSGWLLWVRAGTLVAQRLDLAQAALVGEPVTVADGVGAVSVAATGLVAYRTGTVRPRQLTWVDRSGVVRGTIGAPDDSFSAPRVSPDGRRVVVSRTVEGNSDIWLMDGARLSRVTFDAATDAVPLWSPDGSRIVFRSNRTGQFDLYQKLMNGAGAEERLVESDEFKYATSWSADGSYLLYGSSPPAGNDLWVLPTAIGRTPSVFLKTPFRELWSVFSPDGRWVAYQSNESGGMEIYVRSFVPPSQLASADKPGAAGPMAGAAAGQWQVSTAGGVHATWRPDGKELYYLNPAGGMMATPIAATGSTLEPGAPALLFPTRILGGGGDNQQVRQYDVAPDGRFLINNQLDSAAAPITLLMNWRPPASK